jgi:hypothetical protein
MHAAVASTGAFTVYPQSREVDYLAWASSGEHGSPRRTSADPTDFQCFLFQELADLELIL